MAEGPRSFTLRPPVGLLGAPFSALSAVAPEDVVLCGYFCDNLGGGPPGARFLARQIRYFSEDEVPLERVHDLSDLNVFPLEPQKHGAAIAEQLGLIGAAGAIPIFVGGDRSGADIMAEHVAKLHVISPEAQLSKRAHDRIIAGVDLSTFNPSDQHLQALLHAIEALPETTIGGAVFGSAPALDRSGQKDTQTALIVLRALARKLSRRTARAAA